jgi:tetrapyrrole methylase family protein/MazG family protein
MPTAPETLPSDPLRKLMAIMAILRGPDGCPWDREQDHRTLRTHLLEETYEVLELLDAPEEIDDDLFVEELGDLLLQVVFHAQLATERGAFNLDAIADRISEKLIHRHPHVFSNREVSGTGEVLRNWEKLKREEGKQSALDGVPSILPALLRAHRVLAKVERAGFRWRSGDEAMGKVREEFAEFEEAVADADGQGSEGGDGIAREFGDLIMSLTTLLLHYEIDPELTVREATNRFEKRFRRMERTITDSGESMLELEPADLLERWEQARHSDSAER